MDFGASGECNNFWRCAGRPTIAAKNTEVRKDQLWRLLSGFIAFQVEHLFYSASKLEP
jgi:hypothetical protein